MLSLADESGSPASCNTRVLNVYLIPSASRCRRTLVASDSCIRCSHGSFGPTRGKRRRPQDDILLTKRPRPQPWRRLQGDRQRQRDKEHRSKRAVRRGALSCRDSSLAGPMSVSSLRQCQHGSVTYETGRATDVDQSRVETRKDFADFLSAVLADFGIST